MFLFVWFSLLFYTGSVSCGSVGPTLPWWSSSGNVSGSLLGAVQEKKLFSDSKTFPDMPLLVSIDVLEAAWKLISPPYSLDTLSKFVGQFFGPPGSE